MGHSPEPRIRQLRAFLQRGIAPGPSGTDVRLELGMSPAAEDADVARSLAQIVSAAQVASIGPSRERPLRVGGPRHHLTPAAGVDPSFLGQLSVSGTTEIGFDELDDPRTLICVLRAGSLRQRRAAAARLESLLRDRKAAIGEVARQLSATLVEVRDPAIDYDVHRLTALVPGAAGAANEEQRAWEESVADAQEAVRSFWDGELAREPFGTLDSDRRVLLLHRLRDVPDALVAHLAAVLEGDDGVSSVDARRDLLTICRYAGDARLVPSLVGLLASGPAELRPDAARALGAIDDPRVRRALRGAYERSVDDRERAELAGALAAAGDPRGRGHLRSLLGRGDRGLVLAALRGLEHAGTVEDLKEILPLLRAESHEEVSQAVRTLGRIGDGQGLPELSRLYATTRTAGLRAEIEDAEAAIRARMELLGEAPAGGSALAPPADEPVASSLVLPIRDRLSGLWDFLLGHALLWIGMADRGIARLQRAATRRPGWTTPWVAIAMAWARRGQHAAALAAFRRALSGGARLERNPILVRALARSFLRRAEEVERDGRVDIARGLLGEALAYDLRRAPSTLRFELKRQHELLERRSVP